MTPCESLRPSCRGAGDGPVSQRSVGKRIDTRPKSAPGRPALTPTVGRRKIHLLKNPNPTRSRVPRFCDKENCPLIEFSSLEYGKYLGKTLTAVSVTLSEAGIYVVKFQLDGAGGFLRHPQPQRRLDRLDSAGRRPGRRRRAVAGQDRLRPATTKAISTYDAERDESGEITVKNLEPLKVIDVWRGFDANRPIWTDRRAAQRRAGLHRTTASWTKYNTFWRERPQTRRAGGARHRPARPPHLAAAVWRAIEERALRPT
jgi:hypothetical protein